MESMNRVEAAMLLRQARDLVRRVQDASVSTFEDDLKVSLKINDAEVGIQQAIIYVVNAP